MDTDRQADSEALRTAPQRLARLQLHDAGNDRLRRSAARRKACRHFADGGTP